jgi:hypothetical protein
MKITRQSGVIGQNSGSKVSGESTGFAYGTILTVRREEVNPLSRRNDERTPNAVSGLFGCAEWFMVNERQSINH